MLLETNEKSPFSLFGKADFFCGDIMALLILNRTEEKLIFLDIMS